MRPVPVAALLAVLLVPSAQAGMTAWFTAEPDALLAPEIDAGTFRVTVAVDCADLWARLDPVQLGVGAEANPQVIVSWNPEQGRTFSRDDCATPTGNATRPWTFVVAVTRDAPAREPQAVAFRFELPESQASQGATATLESTVAADVYAVLRVQVPVNIKETSNDRVDYDLEVQNLGNAPSLVRVELDPDQDTVLDLHAPDPVLVQPGGNATLTATLTGSGPWQQATARLRVVGQDPETGQDQEPAYANVLARNGSLGARLAPGPQGPLLAVAVLAAALVARRR